MKAICVLTLACLLTVVCKAQQAEVVVFKHELRWTDETKFPNYLKVPTIRDSVLSETRQQLMNYLEVYDVKLPEQIAYKITSGFGKLRVEMPPNSNGNASTIGIFSFITRATSGYAMFWNFTIIIQQNNKIILQKEVSHELEYFNVSGYASAKRWMSAEKFLEIYNRLLHEALGVIPTTDEKIILGKKEEEEEEARRLLYQETQEEESRSLLIQPERDMLKLNGAWTSAGNFAAILLSPTDTVFSFHFKEGWTWELAKPSFGSVLSSLFTEVTGFGIEYDQKVLYQKKGTMIFEDGQKFAIKLKWIEIATRTSLSDDVRSSRILAPLVAELYNEKEQVGYFLYTRLQESRSAAGIKDSVGNSAGNPGINNVGFDLVHRIEGSLLGKPVFAEYNEGRGIIKIKSGDEILGVMVVVNCNPVNRSAGNVSLSKNKRIMTSSGQNVVKPSMENEKYVEWYPVYFSANATNEAREICVETLVCLFFGIGNM
ncbi:MAG: hypothetical protein Q7U54_15500 [Bacteroidales bacterium]|nr:hypothetical protein [Bacteroidales bacterium]